MTMPAQLPLVDIRPVIVPTADVDFGAEYTEGDPVYWQGVAWNVLDWDYERNAFVLLNDTDWDTVCGSRLGRSKWRGVMSEAK